MHKIPININKVNTKGILLSNKISYGHKGAYKYYVEYSSNEVLYHYT